MIRVLRIAAIAGLAASGAACASMQPHPKSLVRVASPCQDFTVSLYFSRDSDVVTKEASAVLRGAKAQVGACAVTSVDVVGLSDAVGAQDANLIVSRKRAHSVTQALAKAGFPDANISAVAMGEAGSSTEDGVAPLRRRADIVFHLKTPG
jgi:peptidoglycan-associated lipoprotein